MVELVCESCGKSREPSAACRCECGGLLDVSFPLPNVSKKTFESRSGSGVWRYRELVHPLVDEKSIFSRPEGNTNVYRHARVSSYTGIANLMLKHEGENPTGSFKDRGMCVGITEARRLGARTVACASTGNTSASLASYAALAGLRSVVFIPEGKISHSKLSQAIAYGARVLQVKGNFDDAMSLVERSSNALGLYLLNSVNPWRLQGQMSIMFELMQQLGWNPPDWVVVPAGNLGNTSAFGKALRIMRELGFIGRVPRLAAVQAEGAAPFYNLWKTGRFEAVAAPETVATAIRIGNPVSWRRAISAIKYTNGLVEKVSDAEILDAKAVVDAAGIGCEPASATTVAGARKLRNDGAIKADESVACILTGNILKDPDSVLGYHTAGGIFANRVSLIDAKVDAVKRALGD